MINRLLVIAILFVSAVAALAADKYYYQYPNAVRMRDTARIQMYDNLSGTRNITGSMMRYEATGGDEAFVKQAHSRYSSTSGLTPNSQYHRIFEIRNSDGQITYYVQANGRVTIGGNPSPLSVSAVYPANGSTGWYNNYSTGVGTGKKFNVAYVLYSKSVPSVSSTTQQYISGVTQSLTNSINKVSFNGFSAAAATTYTVRVHRGTIEQYDGEWTSTCGVMTDNAGVCESTFTTR
jgi:hypothetical protein